MSERDDKIKEQVKYCNGWRRMFLGCNAAHYALGISMVVLSSVVAAKPFAIGDSYYNVFAWIVAAITAVTTFAKLSDLATRFHNAWVDLDFALALYRMEESTPISTVLDAWRRGEGIIYGPRADRVKGS